MRTQGLLLAAVLFLTSFGGCVVQKDPAVDFSASPTTGAVPLVVQFQDNSTLPEKNILAWQWNFGNGVASNVQNPIYAYTQPGVYDVSLTITTASGNFTTTKAGFIIALADGVEGEPEGEGALEGEGSSEGELEGEGALEGEGGSEGELEGEGALEGEGNGTEGEIGGAMSVSQSVSGGQYVTCATVTVTSVISFEGDGTAITSLGQQVNVPEGWTYGQLLTGANNPAIANFNVNTNELGFGWFTPPPFPTQFSYTLNVPAGQTGQKLLTAQIIYSIGGNSQSTSPFHNLSLSKGGDNCAK